MLRIAIRDSSGERVFVTERQEILVGSREGADLRIPDPAAAPNHCILRAEGGRVRLLSLSSSGTGVGGRRVGEAMLSPGQEFAVGGTVVKVLAAAGASPLTLEEPAPAAPTPRPRARPAPASPSAPPPQPPRIAPPAAAASDFAREVQEAVARAPWYMISLAVHVVLLLLLARIDYEQAPIERVAHMTAVPKQEEPEVEIPFDAPLDLTEIEQEMSTLDEIDLDDLLSQAVRKTPSDAEILDYDDPATAERLGISGSRRPFRLDRPLPYSKVKGGDKTLNKADLEGEQGRATNEVKRDLGDGLREARQKLSKEHICVVRGAHDRIEEILDGYEYPYTLVTRDELLMRGCPKARLLFINCNNRPPPDQKAKLGEFVKRQLMRGCWVVTSDWSVEPYLTEAFPAIVRAEGARRSQRDTTVVVTAVNDDDLLRGVFPHASESSWWLEDSSTMVAEDDDLTVLVASEDMRARYGSRVVAFKFRYGNGFAVHLVGHFYQKDGNLHGLVAMHRLINNVIVERVQADHGR